MISALLLDLDDTLYDEASYLRSGFAVVAERIAALSGAAPSAVLETLLAIEAREGRGRVFDRALAAFGIEPDPALVRRLVAAYRLHRPAIDLDPGIRRLLARLGSRGVSRMTVGLSGVGPPPLLRMIQEFASLM